MNIITELDWNIALNSHYTDLTKLCQSSTQFRNICQDPVFWKQKYIKDFGIPQGFNINSIQDWSRMYKLQVQISPQIRKYIDSLKYTKNFVIPYLQRAKILTLQQGPYIFFPIEDIYGEPLQYTDSYEFDKVIIAETEILSSTPNKGISILVHYFIGDDEYITSINTTNISGPDLINPSSEHHITAFPGLKESLYKDTIVDYEWKLSVNNIKYGNLYILNPSEFVLLTI